MTNEKQIVPRWEWRAFDESFGHSTNPFAAYQPSDTKQSEELYFLSSVTSENAKVRDLLLDIKKLQELNSDGLEQWMPVMKHTFPLPVALVTEVLDVLGAPATTLSRPEYTLKQFLDELIEPDTRLRAVPIHKKRTRYTVEGCMAEMTEVVAEGRRTGTVALELEDPVRVIGTVRKLGLAQFKNTSYPRGLKQLLGMNH